MYLKKLCLENFKCFEKLELEFHKKLTVVTGANDAGKTALLEAIAIAVSTMFVPMDGPKEIELDKTQAYLRPSAIGSTSGMCPQYPVKISAAAMIDGQEVHWEQCLNTVNGPTAMKGAADMLSIAAGYQKRLCNGDTSLILPVLAYYGSDRFWDYRQKTKTDSFKMNTRTNGYVDSLDKAANVKRIMNWFAKIAVWKHQETGPGPVPELEAVFAAMEKCFNRIAGSDDAKIQYNMGTKELDITYTDETGKWMHIPISQLSGGYKSTIGLAADIACRMAILNPQCLEDICNKTPGIVLIDEVDLHLHPAWQQRILSDLTSIFPKVQFIVSTHAPEVINSVPKENVIIIEDNSAIPAPVETYGKDANGILRSVMHVKERPQIIMERFNEFYSAIDTEDYVRAKTILNSLENDIGEDPELTSMRIQLNLEQL